MYKNNSKIKKLETIALKIRQYALNMCIAGGGHLVSAFSCVDIIAVLYCGGILRLKSLEPDWPGRDRFILSKGHAATALYAVLALKGFFSKNELKNYAKYGSMLGSHPDIEIPGVEATTGSLGHGIGIAAGMAFAAKLNKKKYLTYCLMGDGECCEGSVWETAMFASFRKLDNLIVIIDRNRLCVTDYTDNCTGLSPLADKWRSFGWEVKRVDGNCFKSLLKIFKLRKSGKPLVIISDTTKGKGVSFMENDPLWHTRVPCGSQIDEARSQLCRYQK